MNLPNIILAGSLLAGSVSSHALQVLSLSPQGEVARINQVSVKFDEAVANFGDPKAGVSQSGQWPLAQRPAMGV